MLERAQRLDRTDAGQDEAAFFQAEIAHVLHEPGEDWHVEDELRLEKLRTGGDLLAQAFGAPLQRRRERIFHSAHEPIAGWLQVPPRQQLALFAPGSRGPLHL